MSKERAKEVARSLYNQIHTWKNRTINLEALHEWLERLPEFQEPKNEWVKCSDRMPSDNQRVYFWGERGYNSVCEGQFYNGAFFVISTYANVTHWSPRPIPKPPEPEESELVKDIKRIAIVDKCHPVSDEYSKGLQMGVTLAIERVTQHQKAKGK